jgi:hypothetical protein
MPTTSPARVEARVPNPFPRAAYVLGNHVWMTKVFSSDWDNPLGEHSRTIATLVGALNRMDAAALALGGEIDAGARDDLRTEISALKRRVRRGEVREAFSEDWEVLHSEVDRALQGSLFKRWYDFGAALGWYHCEAWAGPSGVPLPDFGFVVNEARRLFEEVGPAVPVLAALVQHAPGLTAAGPGRLLREVLGVEKYDADPDETDRAGVTTLLVYLDKELYRQLAALTRPDPALGANGHGDEKPVWDAELSTLSWRGAVIRQFRAPAKNQIDLIEAFHRTDWARTIPNPFRDDQRKLDKTVTDMNKNLKKLGRPTILFRRDGTGEGVNWGPAS